MDALRTLLAAACLLFISSLVLLPSVSAWSPAQINGPDDAGYKQKYTVLGSRPPRCINKCNACKPCFPSLVAQGGRRDKKGMLLSRGDGEYYGYYLLAWKCRCGDKIFQP
ncbi:hypothetical protein MLD38_007982 [Melastoma candidum]|uniref:Uncharacterized protein n=1 Tax=Melastoma candidum TaxID=119954 RepID=A0ACB9S1F0_9MYRT|nr:hypothetical protein MLD38_007982 [Melastoma candidum]